MPDIPGDSSTTTTITLGSTVTGTIDTAGDHDWYRINLVAGQEVTVTLTGAGGLATALEDPYLYIRKANGDILTERDDMSAGYVRYSEISFKATTSGTYFIDAAAFDVYTGDYQLTVKAFTTPATYTNDQIATHLIDGYWGGQDRRFDLSGGRTITVNLTGLTSDGANLARQALAVWSDIIGVTFSEVGAGGQILFDDDEAGASSSSSVDFATGFISSSDVNVSTQWLTNYGINVGTYSFQTYLHEIGHALGLGHAGFYDGDASFPYDLLFRNDSWETSVMSYFDAQDNAYTNGASFQYLLTPMAADILAVQQLYGLSTTTRAGDTSYGSSGTGIYNAGNYPNFGLTIFDSAGTDTLDYSTFGNGQLINLNPEAFSNVANGIGNLTIARGVVIENATGGSGNDTLIGNSAANVLRGNGGSNSMTGGAGNDTFLGTSAQLGGDIITDFTSGDRIVFTDASLANFTFSVTGSTLNFTGGSLTLTSGISGTLVKTAAAEGGVQLAFVQATIPDVRNDFNGDGRSDILWRSDAGNFVQWLGQASGSFANNPAASGQVGADWSVAGTGDFNGDGRDDILWRSNSGGFVQWAGQPNGGFANNANASGQVGTDWTVAGTGDFNGDNRDDVLWRSNSGGFVEWTGQANGGFANNAAATGQVGTDWHIAGTGDFNGDGRDDILWRGNAGQFVEWTGQANGGFANNAAATGQVGTDWHIAGTGDFNGDGRDDILWRGNAGQFVEWTGQANGGFANNAAATGQVGTDWHIAGTGDFNGDGRDDILWRGNAGQFVEWTGQANGGFANNAAATGQVGLDWHVAATGDYNGDGRDDILWRSDAGAMVQWLGQANGGFSNSPAGAGQVGIDWHIQSPDILFG